MSMLKNQYTGLGTEEAREGYVKRYRYFYGHGLTTVLVSLLLTANERQWSQRGHFYHIVSPNRASIQIVIQVVANLLGLVYVTAICRLINYATRIYFKDHTITLDTLRAWVAFSTPRVDWSLPAVWFVLALALTTTALIPSALWAGAITPIVTVTSLEQSVQIPSYRNASLIKVYPAEIANGSDGSLFTRNANGLFTYLVGTTFAGNILSDVISANGSDSALRQPRKHDNTRYTYFGRSYGVCAMAGIGDRFIANDSLAIGYSYQEIGYSTQVSCIYNTSNALSILKESSMIYFAQGYLPDSPAGSSEYVNYAGIGDYAVVALMVANSEWSPRKYLGIVAGQSYQTLNATQCAFDFTPKLFNVSVGITNRSISVTPPRTISDFDPQRNITRAAMRQLSEMSTVESNFYTSLVGNALDSKIATWKASHPNASTQNATLGGLEDAFTMMMDEILVGFAGAQYAVGNFSDYTPATVQLNALRFGSAIYIYAILTVNTLVVLLFIIEALRNRGWYRFPYFDFLDSRALVVAGAIGGHGIVDAAMKSTEQGRRGIGSMRVRLEIWKDLAGIYRSSEVAAYKSLGEDSP